MLSPSELGVSAESAASGSSSGSGVEGAHAGLQAAHPGPANAAAASPSQLGAVKGVTQARYNKPLPAKEIPLPPVAGAAAAGSALDPFKHRPKLTH